MPIPPPNPPVSFVDGLLESTEADLQCYDELTKRSVSLSQAWLDVDDKPKMLSWDSDLENHLEHRKALIDYEGREQNLPWHIYTRLGLQWIDGYNYAQQSGDCASMGHKNSLKASSIYNAAFGNATPVETYPCATYALARGDGQARFGSGLNLNRMQDCACKTGNFLTSDMGAYDCGRQMRRWAPTELQRSHALAHQSILIPLPSFDFDTVCALCAAGIGVCFGTGRYPTSGVLADNGLCVPRTWKNGGHAMAFTAALEKSGTRYVFLENSHGVRRYCDSKGISINHGCGCWIDAADFAIMAKTGSRYGSAYGHLLELPSS